MSIWELFITAVALSMDAFAVSVCKGLAVDKVKFRHCMITGAWFGGFQMLMPLIGYFAGVLVAPHIEAVDHWIAFFLLLFIGLKLLVHEYFEIDAVASLLIILAVIVISIGASLVIPQKKK